MTDRIETARAFLHAILGPLPADSCIELRLKQPGEKGARREFLPSIDKVDPTKFSFTENVWFGVVLRRLNAASGKTEDLTWATAAWADFDHVENKTALIEKLKRFERPPTAVVDSGGGLHAYWRLTRNLDMKDEGQRTYLREVCYGLAVALGADETVHDPTRVLRLPATFNPGNGTTKTYDPPLAVSVIYQDGPTYGVEDMSRLRRALPQRAPALVIEGLPAPAPLPEKLNVNKRMESLIASGWTEDCGYPSRSELDLAAIIALLVGGHTVEEIVAIFAAPQYRIGDKTREDGSQYLARTIAAARSWITTRVRERDGQLESLHGGKWSAIFNHPMKVIGKFRGTTSGFRVRIDTDLRTFTGADMASNRAFKEALDLAGTWTGSDTDVQLLISYFESQNAPHFAATGTIGVVGDQVVFPEAQLNWHTGKVTRETDYLYIGTIRDAVLGESEDWPALAQEVFTRLPYLHTKSAVIPIIGWFMATFVAPRLRGLSVDGAFPLLMVFGEPEAGKTTILKLMQQLTGLNTKDLHNAQTNTRFANIDLLGSSNTLPVVYDEHRSTDVAGHRYNLYPLLRAAYQGGVVTRGHANLSVTRYRLAAPVALGGETPFRDPALVDRTVHVKLEKAGKDEAVLAQLHALNLHQFNAGFYKHALNKDIAQLWREANLLLPETLRDSKSQIRQRHAWATVALGLLLTEPFWSHGLILELLSGLSDFRHLATTDFVVSDQALISEAIRIIAELIRARRLADGRDYIIRQEGSTHLLWFFPALTLPAIEEYVHKYPSELPLTKETIQSRMRDNAKNGSPIIVKYQGVVYLGSGRTQRATAIDLEQVEAQIGIPVDYWLQSAIIGAQ